MKWNISLTNAAQKQLLNIKDSRIRGQISKHIDGLENDPAKQGKPLGDELYDYRSIKAVKQRYRIIYKLKDMHITVLVVGIGMRKEGNKKDVYAIAKKLERLGLLDLINVAEPEASDKSNEDTQPEISDNSGETTRSDENDKPGLIEE